MRAEIVTVVGNVEAYGIAPGHNASASGREDRSPSIEAVKDDRILRHGVKVGGFYIGMAGESAVPVALVVGHNEYDMRAVVGMQRDEKANKEIEIFHRRFLLFKVEPVEV